MKEIEPYFLKDERILWKIIQQNKKVVKNVKSVNSVFIPIIILMVCLLLDIFLMNNITAKIAFGGLIIGFLFFFFFEYFHYKSFYLEKLHLKKLKEFKKYEEAFILTDRRWIRKCFDIFEIFNSKYLSETLIIHDDIAFIKLNAIKSIITEYVKNDSNYLINIELLNNEED